MTTETKPPQTGTREHPRYEVEIRVDWSTGRMFVSDHVVNLSEGGLCLRAERVVPTDSDVHMVLWLPGRMPVRATGRVVWTLDVRTAVGAIATVGGVQFVNMHAADRALLHEYLTEQALGLPPARGH